MIAVEICLDDVAGALVAEASGADRIELCASLETGGITPSIGTIATVVNSVSRIGVQVLIRQRTGDFVYSSAELDAMVADIESVRALDKPAGVSVGFVFGALTSRGAVDTAAMTRLRDACGNASTTFHKAFDLARDLDESLKRLADLGIDRILTSGGHPSALEGVDTLARLVEQAGTRIAVMAGGGVRTNNAAELLARSGVREIHLRATEPITTASAARDPYGLYDTGTRMVTSAAVIDEVLRAIA